MVHSETVRPRDAKIRALQPAEPQNRGSAPSIPLLASNAEYAQPIASEQRDRCRAIHDGVCRQRDAGHAGGCGKDPAVYGDDVVYCQPGKAIGGETEAECTLSGKRRYSAGDLTGLAQTRFRVRVPGSTCG